MYIPGSRPSFIVKEATSLPKAISLSLQDVMAFTTHHRPRSGQAFSIVDRTGKITDHELPSDASFDTGWSVDSLPLGEPPQEIRHVAFHERRGVYVVSSCRPVDFVLSNENGSHDNEGKPRLLFTTVAKIASRAYTSTSILHREETSIVDARSKNNLHLLIQPPCSPLCGSVLYSQGHIYASIHVHDH